MSEISEVRLPEVIVFAGPNGSGKTTITKMAKTVGEYINADDIKKTTLCSDLEAAVKAEELREMMIEQELCDVLHIYDNTDKPFRIFKKRKDVYYKWTNEYWGDVDIESLTGVMDYVKERRLL